MRLTASVVIYNPDNIFFILLNQLINNSLIELIYIIDNSPSNEKFWKEKSIILTNSKIRYIYSGINLGFGKGHNYILNKDLGEYHIILNPDIDLSGGNIELLISELEQNENVGAAVPKVLNSDGSVQKIYKLLPSPIDLLLRRFLPKYISKNSKYVLNNYDFTKNIRIFNVSGCFILMRTNVFRELNGFDERFFMYMEDVDFGRRISSKYNIVVNPNVIVKHYFAKASYKKIGLTLVHVLSAIKYFNKWGWFIDKERDNFNQICMKQF